eukprot:gene6577-biopygen4181
MKAARSSFLMPDLHLQHCLVCVYLTLGGLPDRLELIHAEASTFLRRTAYFFQKGGERGLHGREMALPLEELPLLLGERVRVRKDVLDLEVMVEFYNPS